MKGALALWNRFFFEPTDARPLGVFRIVFGVYLLVYFQQIRWLLEMNFLRDGYSSHLASRLTASFPHDLFLPLRQAPEGVFYSVYGLTFLLVAWFAIGLAHGVASVLLWIVVCGWLSPIQSGSNSADQVVKILTFLFMIAGLAGHSARRYSVDAWLRRRSGEGDDGRVASWSTRLFQIQLAAIYLWSGFHKASVVDWYNGSAVHFVFFQTAWSRVDMSWGAGYPFLTGLLSYGALFFEWLLFPVLVWNRRTRIPILLFGVAFHLGIALIMKVFVFGEIMILFYLCFLTQEHYDAVGRWVRRWTTKGQAAGKQ